MTAQHDRINNLQTIQLVDCSLDNWAEIVLTYLSSSTRLGIIRFSCHFQKILTVLFVVIATEREEAIDQLAFTFVFVL